MAKPILQQVGAIAVPVLEQITEHFAKTDTNTYCGSTEFLGRINEEWVNEIRELLKGHALSTSKETQTVEAAQEVLKGVMAALLGSDKLLCRFTEKELRVCRFQGANVSGSPKDWEKTALDASRAMTILRNSKDPENSQKHIDIELVNHKKAVKISIDNFKERYLKEITDAIFSKPPLGNMKGVEEPETAAQDKWELAAEEYYLASEIMSKLIAEGEFTKEEQATADKLIKHCQGIVQPHIEDAISKYVAKNWNGEHIAELRNRIPLILAALELFPEHKVISTSMNQPSLRTSLNVYPITKRVKEVFDRFSYHSVMGMGRGLGGCCAMPNLVDIVAASKEPIEEYPDCTDLIALINGNPYFAVSVQLALRNQ